MTGSRLLAAMVLLVPAVGLPADEPPQTASALLSGDDGGSLFRSYCASCHGATARGDGPLAASLRTAPPDLTRWAKRNQGKFDSAQLHRIIDGRDPVKGHGGGDMPVWGDAFKRSREGYDEKAVKARIDGLVAYLKDLQVK